jgi:hypothetical protein
MALMALTWTWHILRPASLPWASQQKAKMVRCSAQQLGGQVQYYSSCCYPFQFSPFHYHPTAALPQPLLRYTCAVETSILLALPLAQSTSCPASRKTLNSSCWLAAVLYRNPLSEIARFLTTYHAGHAKVYNLCSEHRYSADKLPGVLLQQFPFDDHQVF